MRLLAALLPVLFLNPGCGGGAQQATKPTPLATAEKAPAAATGDALLWRVEGAAGSFWLYGTIHTGGAELVPQVAWDALAGSKIFVMELDLATVDQGAIMKRGLIPPGEPPLSSRLSPEAWEKLVAQGGKVGVPDRALDQMKPWLATLVLIQSMVTKAEATDEALSREAKKRGLSLDFLETFDDQISALEIGMDLASLESMLGDLDGSMRLLDELIAAYKAGDVEALERITHDPSQMSEAALKAILLDRNARWVPKLEALAASGGAFVAVGAGHIPGKGGLAELLTARGFTVTRVPR